VISGLTVDEAHVLALSILVAMIFFAGIIWLAFYLTRA